METSQAILNAIFNPTDKRLMTANSGPGLQTTRTEQEILRLIYDSTRKALRIE